MDLSYIAGLFDGEGTICISVRVYPHGPIAHYETISIGCKGAEKIFEELKKEYGGTYIYHHYKDGTKIPYYCLASKKAHKFLKDIYPFLRIKKEQCRLALEFREKFKKRCRWRDDGDELQRREKIRLKIHELNNRGKPLKFRL